MKTRSVWCDPATFVKRARRRVEQFLVVEAVVNRFQNSVHRQSICLADVFGDEWLQADRLPVNYLRPNSPIHE
jgi:hypothetical protein